MMDLPKLGALFLQVLRLLAALAIMLAATVLPVFYLAVAESLWSLVFVLGFMVLCVFVAYLLVRPLIKGPKSS
jgi:membrane protein YdbS with pleckstrin-like domain